MRRKKVIKEFEEFEKEVLVIEIKSTQAIRGRTSKRQGTKGLLYTVVDVLRVNLNQYDTIYRNTADMEVIVEGSDIADVRNAMNKFYQGSNQGGHGGGKIQSFRVTPKKIDKLEDEKNKIRSEYQDQIEELKIKLEECQEKLT